VTAPLSFEEFERQRKLLSFEEFERQQSEEKPRGAISELTRGAALGLAKAGTSLGEVVGMVPGLKGVGEASRRAQQEAEAFYDPRGGFGTAGQVGGRLVGEVAQAATGGPLIAKALGRVAPSAAKAIQAGMAAPSRLTRAGATMAANAPIDVLQGLKEEEGLLLGGRAGSVAENVLFSGAAGALLPAAKRARAPEAPSPIPEVPPRTPEVRPERMLPERSVTTPTPTRQYGGPAGPAIPMAASVEDLRLLGAEATPADIAAYLAQRTRREQAAGRGAIPSATGRTARRPGQPVIPEQSALEFGPSRELEPEAPVVREPEAPRPVAPAQLRPEEVQRYPLSYYASWLMGDAKTFAERAPTLDGVKIAGVAGNPADGYFTVTIKRKRGQKEYAYVRPQLQPDGTLGLERVDVTDAGVVPSGEMARLGSVPQAPVPSETQLNKWAKSEARLSRKAEAGEELEIGAPKKKGAQAVKLTEVEKELAAEREAIQAVEGDTGQLYTMPLEELQALRPKGVLKEGRLPNLTAGELEAELAYETRMLRRHAEDAGFLADEYSAIDFYADTYTRRTMGYQGAKKYFGTAEEARKAKGMSEEMLGALEERNISVEDFREMQAADAKRVATEKRLAKLQDEYDRRGLGDEDVSFDPNEFMRGDEGGMIAYDIGGVARAGLRQAVRDPITGALVGGLTGGATAEEGDTADLVGRTALGAAAGGLGARALLRGATRAPGAATRPGALKGPAAPAVTVNGRDYINVDRITDDPALQQRLVNAAERAVAGGDVPLRKSRVGGEQLGRLETPETLEAFKERVAKKFGMTTTEFVDRTKRGQRVGRDELALAERALDEITREADDIYVKLGQSGAFTPDEARMAERRLSDLYREQDALYGAYSKQITETARDLSALRAGITKSNNPTVWVGRLQKIANRPLTDDERKLAINAARRGDTDELLDLAKQLKTFTFGEKAAAVIRSGMLLAPKTHLANLFGNTLMVGGLEVAKDIPANFFEGALNLARKARGLSTIETKAFDPIATVRASGDGAVRGLRAAKEAVRRGVVDPSKVDLVREVNFKSPLANLAVNAPFRALEASDQFFRQVSIATSLDEQARVMARSEFKGVKGATPEVIAQRTKEILESPSDEMVMRATLAADYATFRDDTALSKLALSLRNKLKGVIGPAAEVLFPFVKTPANIASRIVEYTPLGALKYVDMGKLATLLKGTPDYAVQKKFVEDLGRVATGTAIAYVGYKLAQNDRMTGFYPPTTNERERNRWEATGRQEGSLKVGNQWVEITRLSPFGNLLQVGAALNDIGKGEQSDAISQLLGAATAPTRSVFDLPTVSGVRDIIEAFREAGTPAGGEAVQRYIGRTATSLIPGSALVRGVGYGMDPMVRETRAESPIASTLRRMQAATPGASQALPVRTDPLGEPMRREGGMMQALVSPFPISRIKTQGSPVRQELERTGASVAPVDRRPGESDETFAQRKQVTGTLVARALSAVTTAPGYQALGRMNPEQLRAILQESGMDIEEASRIPDEQLQRRLQGYILERVTQQVKSEASDLFPNQRRGQREAIRRALTRP
jgi:hypothetical protein